jgi:hypothetical protein
MKKLQPDFPERVHYPTALDRSRPDQAGKRIVRRNKLAENRVTKTVSR